MRPSELSRVRLFELVGKKVAQHRGLRGPMTQAKLARLVGVSRAAISALESGQQGISLPTLCLIAAALEISPGELLPGKAELRHLGAGPDPRPAKQLVDEYLDRYD